VLIHGFRIQFTVCSGQFTVGSKQLAARENELGGRREGDGCTLDFSVI
jgi:hypothetical protein